MAISISGDGPSPDKERRRPQGDAPPEGYSLGVPSNTPPSNPTPDLQTGGEDYLDVALYLHHQDFLALAARLDRARESAERKQRGDELTIAGRRHLVRPYSTATGTSAKRMWYRWALQAQNGLQLSLMKMPGAHATVPNGLLTAKSTQLMAIGLEGVWRQLLETLDDLKIRLVRHKISRIDACADLPGVRTKRLQQPFQDHCFVCRARKGRDFGAEEMLLHLDGSTYMLGRDLTGFSLGSGSCKVRVYDKTTQALGKAEIWALLYAHRYPPETKYATRVEYMLRRSRLKLSGIETIEDWLAKRADVVRYFCEDWFRMTTEPVEPKHADRSQTHPLWEHVQQRFAAWAGAPTGMQLKPLPKAEVNAQALLQQLIGLGVTIAARERMPIDSNEAFLQRLFSRIEGVIPDRQMAYEVSRRALELGIIF